MLFSRAARLMLFALLLVITVNARADAPATQPANVNLLAWGDWGTNGPGQRKMAGTLSKYVAAAHRPFSAALLLGDNFYIKLSRVDDPLFDEMFEHMYDAAALAFPFYAALGNHDYSTGNMPFELAYARENPNSRWKIPRRWYRVDFPSDHPIVSALMLDSDQPYMTETDWSRQQQWIDRELSKPRTGWMIACAHHPLFSNGDHGDNGVLQRDWGTLFKRNKLDFYLCGHDHDVQHLEVPGFPTTFILAGGGGARIRPMRVDRRGPFSKSTMGFADLSFSRDTARVRLVDSAAKVIHEFERTREGKISTLESLPSDVATPRTIKSIARPDADVPATKP